MTDDTINISTAAPPCPVCKKEYMVYFPYEYGGSVWVCTSPHCNYQITRKKEQRIHKFNF